MATAAPKSKTRAKARTKAKAKATAKKPSARNVFLAGLGAYSKAIDEAQSHIREAQSQLQENRSKAENLFSQLVKRGEKVESSARDKLKDIDLPELILSDREVLREDLRARLDKARESFDTLRDAVSNKAS
jgi:hypothetical protein